MDTQEQQLFLEIGVKNRMLTQEQSDDVLRTARPGQDIGQILVSKGVITPANYTFCTQILQQKLAKQANKKKSAGSNALDTIFGLLTVRKKLCTADDVQRLATRSEELAAKGTPVRLPKLMVDERVLSFKEMKSLAAQMTKSFVDCNQCKKRFNMSGWDMDKIYACTSCGAPLHLPENVEYVNVGEFIADLGMQDLTSGRPRIQELIGRVLGGCRIKKRIAAGGMGYIFLGEHLDLRTDVAIKILSEKFDTDPLQIRRFKREAQASARLRHPNVVQVLGVGEELGWDYIVMQFVDGQTAQKFVEQKGALSLEKATRIIIEAAKGLAEAHRAGMVHRDVKPENILVSNRGQVMITDFGLVADYAASDLQITDPNLILGTPYYLSPEQCRGTTLDGRADLYSLGVSYFYLLTGRRPFEAATHYEVISMQLNDPPPDPRSVVKDIPAEAAQICLKMMAKNPKDRFKDCDELAAIMEKMLASQGHSAPSGNTSMIVQKDPTFFVSMNDTAPGMKREAAAAAPAVRESGPASETAAVDRFVGDAKDGAPARAPESEQDKLARFLKEDGISADSSGLKREPDTRELVLGPEKAEKTVPPPGKWDPLESTCRHASLSIL